MWAWYDCVDVNKNGVEVFEMCVVLYGFKRGIRRAPVPSKTRLSR